MKALISHIYYRPNLCSIGPTSPLPYFLILEVECQAVPPEKSFSHEDLVVWLSHTNVFMSYMNYVMCYSFPVLDAVGTVNTPQ